ncbi:hypothetical protein [Poseidonibacter lekithochrous]|uniref:hypothetical protein n=1 Tax=Poseidonibacter lekithochrous TaxID=1904463 RepID=UPI0008FC694B|nr:hypothetical protein [Poseidonibacter lekithochrous]QKJ23254.1 hypothetical protein ALEK_1991 [Poseidonibacter lekithochrous]
MKLEKIQKELISSFDFDRTIEILEKLDEKFEKKDLEEIANNLIKLLFQSRENEEMIFSSGPLVASRTYIDGLEVSYALNFSLQINSEFSYELEKPINDIYNEKNIIKEQLEALLEENQKEYDKNEDNDLAFSNVRKLEKMIILLD